MTASLKGGSGETVPICALVLMPAQCRLAELLMLMRERCEVLTWDWVCFPSDPTHFRETRQLLAPFTMFCRLLASRKKGWQSDVRDSVRVFGLPLEPVFRAATHLMYKHNTGHDAIRWKALILMISGIE